jgi:GAF domain-containing protein
MDHAEANGKQDGPGEAPDVITQQAAEIADLRRQLEDEQFAKELREALALAATVSTVAAPVTHSRLLEMIVATAAHVISANAASLFLIDYETQELTFEVALGQKADEVRKFRVPLGKGVAGLVALSGQALAISDAQRDARVAADIGQSIGYVPQSILCVPLYYNDQVIGVLELLDKIDAPAFDASDMDALGLFANQAAVAIEQSRVHRNIGALINDVLKSFTAPGEQRQHLQQHANTFASYVEGDAEYRQALDLARLVQEIAWQGEKEARACRTILQAFADYLRSRQEPLSGLDMLG